MSEKMYCLLPG